MRKITILLISLATRLAAQDTAAIDKAVNEVLTKTGAPSASIAVVKDGKIAYTQAYGLARIDPPMPAKPDMRYSIGSISKQFTAAAILMMAEEGKLSLDDKLVRWFPDLTRANEVTVRELLSMTSGYQDFWPQDYVMPRMLEPVTAQEILNDWARKPLDFDPGTKWQYSNTNYVVAGLLVEKVAGMPLIDLLQRRVFGPLQMTSVFNTDLSPLGSDQPTRYLRYAVGPLRPAPKEGRGWMFAAGELAMTAHDLALWDISMIDQTVLKPASYSDMEREVLLNNGASSGYGLGVLYLFFGRTLYGKALHATAVNRVGARLVGISPNFAGTLTFGVAALMCAFCGVLIGPITTIYYDSGFLVSLKGFVGAIIGGLISYPLAAAGALLVGLLESFSSFWASAFKEVIVFTLIIPVLLWRSLTTHHHEEEE